MEFEEIWSRVSAERPTWLSGWLDHLFTIPGTKSCVFYPYEFSSADEDRLSRLCSERGYVLVRKPKEESEYHPASYKILILEPWYDDEKIEHGCGLIAKFIRIHRARGEAGTLDLSHVGELLNAIEDVLRAANRHIPDPTTAAPSQPAHRSRRPLDGHIPDPTTVTMPWRMGAYNGVGHGDH